MNHRDSPIYWSFPCGTWYETRIRMSVFMPLVAVVVYFRLQRDLRLAALFMGVMLISVLLHEFGHVVAARMTWGRADEILLWPFGGLAFAQPAGTFHSRFLTAAGGPIVNLALCAITVWAAVRGQHGFEVLNPLKFPLGATETAAFGARGAGSLPFDILVLTFWINWVGLWINLIPVFPFDGGRMLHAVLSTRWENDASTEIYLRVGSLVGLLAMIVGMMYGEHGNTWLLFIGAAVLILNLGESYQLRTSEAYDESFMGYDFSQGYTSLEKAEAARPPRKPGVFRRWLQERKASKLERSRQKQAEFEQQVDQLLQKVHAQGIDSLTDAERRLLKRASDHLRTRDREH